MKYSQNENINFKNKEISQISNVKNLKKQFEKKIDDERVEKEKSIP